MDDPASHDQPPQPEQKLPGTRTFAQKYAKYRWLIIALILVFIGGLIAIISNTNQEASPQPTTPPTPSTTPFTPTTPTLSASYKITETSTGWKIYQNFTHNFEIQVPPESVLDDTSTSTYIRFQNYEPHKTQRASLEPGKYYLEIHIDVNSCQENIDNPTIGPSA